MDKRQFAYLFVAYVVILTIYTFYNNEKIVATINNDGMTGFLYYFISNPAYVLLFISIAFFNREVNIIRNTLGGFLIVYSADIISYPRLASSMSNSPYLLASSDGIVITHLLKLGISYPHAYILYYLIMPIALLIIALWLLGINDFYKRFIKHG